MNLSKTFTINSGHVADALDSQIVMLAKTLQVENPDAPFDDALQTTRTHLNKKVIELMPEEDIENITEIANVFKKRFKENPDNEHYKMGYVICRYFGLYRE